MDNIKKRISIVFVSFFLIFLSAFFTPQSFVFAVENPESVSIYLNIESATSTLFSGTVSVSACSVSDSSPLVVSGYCAIQQSGLTSVWSTFGDDKFLDSISGISNDFSNGLSWGWFSDQEYGQTSLGQHILSSGENLLVNIGRMPLKLSISTTTPFLNSTTTVSVYQFGFDDSWNGVWLRADQSNIETNGEFFLATSSEYGFFVSTSTSFYLKATKDGFLPSNIVEVFPIINEDVEVEIVVPNETQSPSPTGGSNQDSNGSSNENRGIFDVKKALEFLASKQKSDGSFGSSLYTDWVAIALASSGQSEAKEKITLYLKTTDDTFSNVTDYERHAMALMALNINPYNGTPINYIQEIVDGFDGNQIGDSSLVNDDVFAIFPLMKAGYSSNDLIIQKIIEFILLKQKSNGSWENSVDLTASAIQALALFSSNQDAKESSQRAREYLSSHQQSGGGFGSVFSTSWTLQAISALQESSSDWVENGKNPDDALYSAQQEDGGVGELEENENTRIWATSYAIPSALHKTWSSILHSFSKKQVVASQNSDKQVEVKATENDALATSTDTIATTTLPITQSIEPAQEIIISDVIVEDQNDFKPPIVSETKEASQVEEKIENEDETFENFSQLSSAITANEKGPFNNVLVSVIIALTAFLCIFLILKLIKK